MAISMNGGVSLKRWNGSVVTVCGIAASRERAEEVFGWQRGSG